MCAVRVAVVGTGAWGLAHVRTLAAEPRASLTWVCDTDPAAVSRAVAIAPGCRAVSHVEEILSAPDVEAVVLATPATTHAELAVRFIESGRHVLVEKPLALSLSDARRVEEAARKAGVTGMVGHLMIYHPAVAYLRRLLAAGELGDVFYLTSVRANLGRLRSDENALWSFGPHDLSMIDHLVPGRPTTITARGESYLQPGIADVVFVNVEIAPDGGGRPVMAQVQLSWLSPRKERRLTIVGSRKMVEFDDCETEKLRIYDRGYDRPPPFADFAEYLTIRYGDIYIPQVPMLEPLAAEIGHFLDCIRARTAPTTDLSSGVRGVMLLAAAQASLERGGVPAVVE